MMSAQSQVIRLKHEEERKVGRSLTEVALRRLRRDTLTLFAMGLLILLGVLAILAPVISTNILNVNANRTNVAEAYMPVGTPGHVLGTDDLGRDHLARLLFAGQVSLSIAFTAAALSLVIGVSVGMIMGYYGGVIDDVLNWFISTLNSIPSLFLLLIISAVLSPGPATLILVLGFLGWTGTARLVRGETLSLREREFVVAARAAGAGPLRIMVSHVLPNLVSVIVVTLALDIGSLILVEAALSFLGLGVKPPTPTWGNMLSDAQTYFRLGPHLVVMPGLLIFTTVLCLFVIGDGIRDAFDPTSRD
jgi:peptide/nickel transport system permease protein